MIKPRDKTLPVLVLTTDASERCRKLIRSKEVDTGTSFPSFCVGCGSLGWRLWLSEGGIAMGRDCWDCWSGGAVSDLPSSRRVANCLKDILVIEPQTMVIVRRKRWGNTLYWRACTEHTRALHNDPTFCDPNPRLGLGLGFLVKPGFIVHSVVSANYRPKTGCNRLMFIMNLSSTSRPSLCDNFNDRTRSIYIPWSYG